ncbi:hypothetical protein PspLS_11779 [Pyricularia sp. CBS 133598]|nr:hypothetical protein PspLS_11779 [Pyricularia sp. CBS 133598]
MRYHRNDALQNKLTNSKNTLSTSSNKEFAREFAEKIYTLYPIYIYHIDTSRLRFLDMEDEYRKVDTVYPYSRDSEFIVTSTIPWHTIIGWDEVKPEGMRVCHYGMFPEGGGCRWTYRTTSETTYHPNPHYCGWLVFEDGQLRDSSSKPGSRGRKSASSGTQLWERLDDGTGGSYWRVTFS